MLLYISMYTNLTKNNPYKDMRTPGVKLCVCFEY